MAKGCCYKETWQPLLKVHWEDFGKDDTHLCRLKVKREFIALEDTKLTEHYLATVDIQDTLYENIKAIESHSTSNSITSADAGKCGRHQLH